MLPLELQAFATPHACSEGSVFADFYIPLLENRLRDIDILIAAIVDILKIFREFTLIERYRDICRDAF